MLEKPRRAATTGEAGRPAFERQAGDAQGPALGLDLSVKICAACSSVNGAGTGAGRTVRCVRACGASARGVRRSARRMGRRRRSTPGGACPVTVDRSLLSTFTGRGAAANRAWLSRVEPAIRAACAEIGLRAELAVRDEAPAVDGSGFVVRFSTRTQRLLRLRLVRLGTTRIAKSASSLPATFSAGLPIEQLAEAWATIGVLSKPQPDCVGTRVTAARGRPRRCGGARRMCATRRTSPTCSTRADENRKAGCCGGAGAALSGESVTAG